MKIFVKPPYQPQLALSLEEINERLNRGELDGNEPAWTAGITNWVKLDSIDGVILPSPPPLSDQYESSTECNSPSNVVSADETGRSSSKFPNSGVKEHKLPPKNWAMGLLFTCAMVFMYGVFYSKNKTLNVASLLVYNVAGSLIVWAVYYFILGRGHGARVVTLAFLAIYWTNMLSDATGFILEKRNTASVTYYSDGGGSKSSPIRSMSSLPLEISQQNDASGNVSSEGKVPKLQPEQASQPSIDSENLTPIKPREQELSQTYGFILGQQATLSLIQDRYPQLASEVQNAAFAFNSSALGEGSQGIEEELSRHLGEKWPEAQKTIKIQVDSVINGNNLDEQTAISFINQMKERSGGKLPDSILATLLSANRRYVDNPGLELSEGWKQTYRTDGHPKSKGLDFSISFPYSWTKSEGFRPNIIQVFRSGAGRGPIFANLMVQDLEYEPTAKEISESFQSGGIQQIIPHNGSFVSLRDIAIEGCPGKILVYDYTENRLDTQISMRMNIYMIFYKHYSIQIQFVVMHGVGSTLSFDELQDRFSATYATIANTLVLNERY